MHAVLRKQEDLNPLTIYHYACSIEETRRFEPTNYISLCMQY